MMGEVALIGHYARCRGHFSRPRQRRGKVSARRAMPRIDATDAADFAARAITGGVDACIKFLLTTPIRLMLLATA